MIRRKYEDNKYVVYVSKREKVDLDALNLLASEKDDFFFRCSYRESRLWHIFSYEISTAQVVFNENNLNFTDAISIIDFYSSAIQHVRMYNFELGNLELNVSNVYQINGVIKAIYIPIYSRAKKSIRDILYNSIRCLNINDNRITILLSCIYDSDEDKCLDVINNFLNNTLQNSFIDSEEPETSVLTPMYSEEECETSVLTPMNSEEEPETSILLQENQDDFEETTVLSKINDIDIKAVLIACNTGQQVNIDREVYIIGSDEANVDFYIKSSNVSRRHAIITIEDDKVFLTDNNSTNGTTLEGLRIEPNKKMEIFDNSIVSFANEFYQLKIERR